MPKPRMKQIAGISQNENCWNEQKFRGQFFVCQSENYCKG
jgi:hypothetical protein